MAACRQEAGSEAQSVLQCHDGTKHIIIVYMLFCAFCYSFCVFAMPIRYLTFVNIGLFFTYNSMLWYASI